MKPSAVDVISAWSDTWVAAMWDITWQSCLLVALAGLVATCVLRRVPPAGHFWFWQWIAAKLLLLPVISISLPYSSRPFLSIADAGSTRIDRPNARPDDGPPVDSASLAAGAITETAAAVGVRSWPWREALLVVWLSVIVAQLVRVAWQYRLLRRLVDLASPCDSTMQLEVTAQCHRLGIAVPRCVITDQGGSPFVCGIFSPTVVLPSDLVVTTRRGDLRPVLLHELAHLKRRDLLWLWIPQIVRTVYWFHPAAHYVVRRLALERELACDAIAIEYANATVAEYSQALIEAVSRATARVPHMSSVPA